MQTQRTEIRRYSDRTRMNHWAVAILFFCAALSGLAFFHPSMFFFTALFGGGTWTRILHPYMGLAMVILFFFLFVTMWRENLWTRADSEWMRKSGEMFRGHKENLPPVGKYNGGQKLTFWLMSLSLLVLLVTGFLFWHAWFPDFPILARRVAVVLHAVAAVVLVLSVIVHVYAAIWIKGTIRAMTRGTVSHGWARTNHPLWHRDMTQGTQGK